jgi:hypothetical protein
VLRGWNFLRQLGNPDQGSDPQAATIQHLICGNDVQKRGFAGAVSAYQADTLARFNAQGNVVKDCHMAEGETSVVDPNQAHDALKLFM